jgi:hypothetical protein
VRAPARLAAFAAVAAVAFAGAAAVGAALPSLREPGEGGHGHGALAADGHSAGHSAAATTGLAVAEGGYAMAPDAATLPLGRETSFAFRIAGPDGRPVTDLDIAHERRMHLIVVRRDLSGYQHLHPSLGPDGRWRVALALPRAGVYRAFADFRVAGRPVTLATDLFVGGPFRPVALPAPAAADRSGAYRAELAAPRLAAGRPAVLAYALSRGGRPLDGVQPYLGADGHLVALREGDLAFAHLHPEESGTPGTIRFAADLPSPGRYRLFLQFRHDGRVRTVAHTVEVGR